MFGAPRLLTVATFLAAGALALGACGAPDALSEDSDATTTTSAADTEKSTTTRSAEAASEADGAASPLCGDDPRTDDDTEVVVNRGQMDCADVTTLLDEYLELARSGQFGNAGIVPDIDGFSCASPTARSAGIAGLHTKCSTSEVEILVRPSEPRIPGVQQDVARFIPDGSITNGRSFFALPGGQAACAIYPDHTPPNAECYGPMPIGLPETTGLMGHVGEPTSLRVDEAGPARLTITGAAPYPLDGVPFTTLEVGQTLASSGFACTVTAADSVTCTNADGQGFSYSPAEVSLN